MARPAERPSARAARPALLHAAPLHAPGRRRLAGLLIGTFLLAGCATPAGRTPPPPPPAPWPQSLAPLARQHQVCAVAVAVIRQGRPLPVETASGCGAGAAPPADGVFQAASLSKPVFAYAVMRLVRQGRLSLDHPLTDYLAQGWHRRFSPLQAGPVDVVTDPRLAQVTARQVLSHTSGLPNWSSGPLAFESTPGTRWSYSGEGFMLLQQVVEALSGQALERFMSEQVFGPLGMAHSSFLPGPRLEAALLPGRKADGTPRKPLRPDSAAAAFSLYTTAGDYAKFVAAVLADTPLHEGLDAGWVSMGADAPAGSPPGPTLGWALGWGLERGPGGLVVWHWGNNPGYRAFVMASLATGDGFVMLSGSERGLALAGPLARQLLPGEHPALGLPQLEDDWHVVLCLWLGWCL